MQKSERQITAERLTLLEEIYPCEFRVLNYYTGHHRLIIVASHLDDLKLPMVQRRRFYIECEFVYYMQVVPEWETLPLQLLDEEQSRNAVKKVGLFHNFQTDYLPCVLDVENHKPEIIIFCHEIYVHRKQPESRDYPHL